MTRTIGAAVGALLIVLFMAYIAGRLTSPVAAQTTTSARQTYQR